MAHPIDRTAASQALAKTIADHQAGNAEMAKQWAQRLVAIPRAAGIDVPRPGDLAEGSARNTTRRASSPRPAAPRQAGRNCPGGQCNAWRVG